MWTEPRPGTLVVDGLTAAREKEARLEAVRERLTWRHGSLLQRLLEDLALSDEPGRRVGEARLRHDWLPRFRRPRLRRRRGGHLGELGRVRREPSLLLGLRQLILLLCRCRILKEQGEGE